MNNLYKGLAFLDIETISEESTYPILICIKGSNSLEIFKNISKNSKKFKDIILKKENFLNVLDHLEKNFSLVYCHNLNFDGRILLNYFSLFDLKVEKIIYVDNRLYKFEIIWKKKKIEFRCSLCLLSLSLNELSKKILKKEKKWFPIEYVKMNNSIDYVEKETNRNIIILLEEYCIEDVNLLEEIFLKIFYLIWNKFNINIIEEKILTASSLSMFIYINFFNNAHNQLCSLKKDIDEKLRPSFFGGRTEVFSNLCNYDEYDSYHYDMPTFYSGILQRYKYPSSCIEDFFENNEKFIVENEGVYRVRVSTKYLNDFSKKIPILPYRKENVGTIYPLGEWEGSYYSEELAYFIENGGKILNIYNYYRFLDYTPKFSEYCEKISSMFEEEDSLANKYMRKQLLNKLFGKFSMITNFSDCEWIDKKHHQLKLDIYKKKDIFMHSTFVSSSESDFGISFIELGERKYFKNNIYNISISLIVTARGRITMHKLFKNLYEKKAIIHYTDTDSVFFSVKKGDSNDIDGLYLKEKIYNCFFYVPKMYHYETKEKEQIFKIKGMKIDDKYKNYDHCSKLKELFLKKENIFFSNQKCWIKKNLLTYIKDGDKRLLFLEKKRNFDSDHINSNPLEIY